MAVGDYISEIQTSDGNTHLIGSSVWVSAEEWNGKTITEVETEIKTKFSNLTEITWSSLKSLVDTGSLIPGMHYRITDYQCTTTQDNTRSAGHVFDIIVVADDEGTLNENAHACLHNGDTYFAGCKLDAWELKYSLDNDTDKFAWADATNGKGVVWWMKDEWNNECFYDFKNIQYKRWKVTGAIATQFENGLASFIFSDRQPYFYGTKDPGTGVVYPSNAVIDENAFDWFYTFTARVNAEYSDASLREHLTEEEKTQLQEKHNNTNSVVSDCVIGKNISNISADDMSTSNKVFLNNAVIYNEIMIKTNNGEITSVTGGYAHSIRCGNNCHSWTCGNNCPDWTCGDSCFFWTCGNNCNDWTCGNFCPFWVCGNGSMFWTCGNFSYGWVCGKDCQVWVCGDYCISWTCGNDCAFWTCGNNCMGWTCGNDCAGWTCGNFCSSWTCGNNCMLWVCGCYCMEWACGNNCSNWTCGNNCVGWTCGNEVSDTKVLQDYVSNFCLDNDVSNITIKSNGTPTEGQPLKNFVVKSGVMGTDSAKLAIVIDTANFPLGSDYQWTIAKNSKGEIKQYCEADLIN